MWQSGSNKPATSASGQRRLPEKLDVGGTSYVRRGDGIQDKIVLDAGDTNVGLELRSETTGGTPFIDLANDATADFVVKELNNGKSNARFMWQVSAHRKEYGNIRLEQV